MELKEEHKWSEDVQKEVNDDRDEKRWWKWLKKKKNEKSEREVKG